MFFQRTTALFFAILNISNVVKQRLTKPNPPTAIFCCNDWMAIGAINAAKQLGFKVPEDFSIIGFDNIIISKIIEPKLTTVDQGMFRLGLTSAKLLLNMILGESDKTLYKKIILDTNLIKRSSCVSIKGRSCHK
ncbi:MAG: substrate-binding domain-containing protein [Clostridia bacterium]|nr:substrate-binding domain-containing protein [Clostridia bacterium]